MTFVASILSSILIIRYVDLEPYKRQAFGRYVERYMTREMQGIRLAGYLIMLLGLLVVLFGWSCGVLFPRRGG